MSGLYRVDIGFLSLTGPTDFRQLRQPFDFFIPAITPVGL
jgi:hypothetical protein